MNGRASEGARGAFGDPDALLFDFQGVSKSYSCTWGGVWARSVFAATMQQHLLEKCPSEILNLPTANGPAPIAAQINGCIHASAPDHLNTLRRLTDADGQVTWQWLIKLGWIGRSESVCLCKFQPHSITLIQQSLLLRPQVKIFCPAARQWSFSEILSPKICSRLEGSTGFVA